MYIYIFYIYIYLFLTYNNGVECKHQTCKQVKDLNHIQEISGPLLMHVHEMYDNEQGMRMTISKVHGENCHSFFRPCMSACKVSSRPRYFQRLMRARKQIALMNGPILKKLRHLSMLNRLAVL